MTSISKDALRGYVLEELLAYWIRNTGYRLLVDESQDPDELEALPNGLGVRGRGGTHQVDALGELAWVPAFTFPIRLIVEAKARNSGRVGIDDVRNAVGVVTDVNQNYSRVLSSKPPLVQKFAYRYALFSTTGFSQPATDYALAHQLSLVDLSAPEFGAVRSAANDVTDALYDPAPPSRAGGYVKNLRAGLRLTLGTWPEEVPSLVDQGAVVQGAETVERVAREINELFVGMANGPYLILLRADHPERVIAALDEHPVRRISIEWRGREAERTRWLIRPTDGDDFELYFTLPAPVAQWIFDPAADARRRALYFKEAFLSTITIYRFVNGRDRLYRLEFTREDVPPHALR